MRHINSFTHEPLWVVTHTARVNVNHFHAERLNRENGTTFTEFPFVPGIFQWHEPKKRLPFTSQQEFPGICGK